MENILYIKNIKERLFSNLSDKEFEVLFYPLINNSINNQNHIWYDTHYLNSCLELFFTFFEKFNDPLTCFYALLKPTYKLSDTLLNKKLIIFSYTYFINNDLNVTENDFNLLKSILVFYDYVPVVITEDLKLFSGFSHSSETSLNFKLKGKADKNNIKQYIPGILEQLCEKAEYIFDNDVYDLYTKRIEYIAKEFNNFRVKE